MYAGNNTVRYVDHCCKNGRIDYSGNKKYIEINFHGKINTEPDEVGIKNMIIYEDTMLVKYMGIIWIFRKLNYNQ